MIFTYFLASSNDAIIFVLHADWIDLRIDERRFRVGMPEQMLNNCQIHTGRQRMRREGVPHEMRIEWALHTDACPAWK